MWTFYLGTKLQALLKFWSLGSQQQLPQSIIDRHHCCKRKSILLRACGEQPADPADTKACCSIPKEAWRSLSQGDRCYWVISALFTWTHTNCRFICALTSNAAADSSRTQLLVDEGFPAVLRWVEGGGRQMWDELGYVLRRHFKISPPLITSGFVIYMGLIRAQERWPVRHLFWGSSCHVKW